ncbi:hypothetical protein BU26DRAFT_518097 [Trematosphaeria pertusa]|uniref:Uncharacterized protein n=1 Tax=Trematosphaeria pertusa TaxID=390896 RepID=A0A6A6IMX4_9PLEO|nr:uncharacterized protein BU26DRAFT_518097 [Trematosphaeria pertusa]KAF2251448.1 hypothetical protein BU26DRAFT_518097 [Trematosphaeria pertusa]
MYLFLGPLNPSKARTPFATCVVYQNKTTRGRGRAVTQPEVSERRLTELSAAAQRQPVRMTLSAKSTTRQLSRQQQKCVQPLSSQPAQPPRRFLFYSALPKAAHLPP